MTPTYTYMNTYCIIYVYPETITRYYGMLYYTSLRPVHESTTINCTNRSGGGSPFRCRLLLCPPSPREAFGLLSFYRIVTVYRFIVMVIELPKQFRYDIQHYYYRYSIKHGDFLFCLRSLFKPFLLYIMSCSFWNSWLVRSIYLWVCPWEFRTHWMYMFTFLRSIQFVAILDSPDVHEQPELLFRSKLIFTGRGWSFGGPDYLL